MKKVLCYLFIFILCLFLLSCEQPSSKNKTTGLENNMNKKDIFDFKHIDSAPKATEKHPINEVIKVFLDEWSIDVPYKAVAIDIKKNEVYINPSISIRGLSAGNGIVQISNAEKVLEVLKKYEVQNWKTDYTFENPETYEDGYSWKILLQFEDGTVEKHSGKGTDKERLTPDNFESFFTEINEFIEERLEENDS